MSICPKNSRYSKDLIIKRGVTKLDGHSVKNFNSWHNAYGMDDVELGLEDKIQPIKLSKNRYLLPVTELDLQSDFSSRDLDFYHGSALSKKKHWESVPAILEEHNVKKTTRYGCRENPYSVYELPVVDYVLIKENMEKKNPKFMWNGKKYRTDTIYYRSSGTFTKCSKTFIKYGKMQYVDVKKLKIERLPFTFKRRPRTCAVGTILGKQAHIDANTLLSIGTDTVKNTKKFYIDIAFQQKTTVTHMSSMGRTLNTKIYYGEDNEFPASNYIQYVTETDNSGVSKFELHYRVENSKPWKRYGIVTGNINRLSEVLVEFNPKIIAQYIRLIPIVWEGALTTNIGFFGKPYRRNISDMDDDSDCDCDSGYDSGYDAYKTVNYRLTTPMRKDKSYDSGRNTVYGKVKEVKKKRTKNVMADCDDIEDDYDDYEEVSHNTAKSKDDIPNFSEIVSTLSDYNSDHDSDYNSDCESDGYVLSPDNTLVTSSESNEEYRVPPNRPKLSDWIPS
jgi:hypothetical protein